MKQFVFLLAACVCPHGLLFAVSADESRSIALTADEIVQRKEVTVSSADTDDVSVKSEISITATVNATDEPVDENIQIGDTDVKTTEDLVTSVAASDGKELTLSIIRHGEPMEVVVTPRKMEFPVVLAPALASAILGDLNSQSGVNIVPNPAWQSLPESVKKQLADYIGVQNSLHKFHPGIVIEQRMPSNEKDMQGLIEHVRKLAEDSGKVAHVRSLKAVMSDESGTPNRMAESIEALRGQVRVMEEKLEQLEKRLAAEGEGKK